jgi:hypothetical protein
MALYWKQIKGQRQKWHNFSISDNSSIQKKYHFLILQNYKTNYQYFKLSNNIIQIWEFHDSEDLDSGLLVYDTM